MEQTPPTSPDAPKLSPEALQASFQEYQSLAEGTDKVTDRRQTVNTLFVSINALFLTGVGYLLLQFFQSIRQPAFVIGFLAIAIITTRINNSWLKLSEQNRRLVNLRIRYLKEIEKQLRDANFLPTVTVPLDADETTPDGPRSLTTRGTYSLEDVLYSPSASKAVYSFSKAEQQIGHAFTWSYWLAFAFALVVSLLIMFAPVYGF